MRSSYLILLMVTGLISCLPQGQQERHYASFADYPVYPEANLWPQYTPEATTFSLWSPPAEQVQLQLYEQGQGGEPYATLSMLEEKPGLWKATVRKDLKGVYYTFMVKTDTAWLKETPGIYAQAAGVNGKRAMVVDLASTNPEGWENDRRPNIQEPNEAVIYELHVRDITSHPNSGSSHPGKFIGLVEQGTKGPEGVATGIDHMKEMGITHVHLLPSFDHQSIDETRLKEAQFNWGYDPQNYNVPEGSYSTDAYNGAVRIREFKQMVKAFHDNGIGVILDVVYNHTGRTEGSNFNREVPGYYYRFTKDSSWSNASACGNETASERTMMRNFIVESAKYWAREYHLDGFRFDLMGIHDQQTMNEVASALEAVDSSIFVYGEGWTAGESPLPPGKQALKKHTHRMKQVSAFSDDIRDGLKGSVFDDEETGFVSGAAGMEPSVKFGVAGAIKHPQIDYAAVNYSDTAWAHHPWQAVSYVSCHDNHTLYDKLRVSRPDASPQEIQAMHKLANAVVLTSQGIPFLHAGVEMMRTKNGAHNSYNLPDSINQIDWQWKVEQQEVVNYYRKLIALRKAHPAFFMEASEQVRKNLIFTETLPGVVTFTLNGKAAGDSWKDIMVCYNATQQNHSIAIRKKWQLAALGDQINPEGLRPASGAIRVPPVSMMIAFRKE